MRKLVIIAVLLAARSARADLVLAVDKEEIYVDMGARDGVGAGTQLELLHEVVAKDPRTGATLKDRFSLGTLEVTKAGDKLCVARADPELAKRLAKIIYHAGLGIGRDIASVDVIAELAAPLGIKAEELKAALNDPKVKDRLRVEVDGAIARNVFGSPFFIVDGEPFWGADRLDHVERWLATGGW